MALILRHLYSSYYRRKRKLFTIRKLTKTKILNNLNNMITVLKQNVNDMLEIIEERERQVQDLNNQIYEIEKQLESHN